MQSFIGNHDLSLVALSYGISVVGALVSLYLAEFIVDELESDQHLRQGVAVVNI